MAEKTPTRREAPLLAQDKLTILLSLVPFLVERGRAGVAETAAHFGVSEGQIRDSVRLIAMSGIPGETTTYQSEDLFDIDWDDFLGNDQISLTHLVAIDDSPRFSAREASALIAGLQYLSSLPENADREALASLKEKLSHGASAQPAHLAVEARDTDATVALIRDAVAGGTQLEFDYLNARGVGERRRVDPLRVESMDADWYLRGWCHLRDAVRTFRIDRISNAVVTGAPVVHSAAELNLPDTLFEVSDNDLSVTIEFVPEAAVLLADYITDGIAAADDGRLRTVIRVPHFHGLKRLMATMSGIATVTDPPEARLAVAEWAIAGAARYAREKSGGGDGEQQ